MFAYVAVKAHGIDPVRSEPSELLYAFPSAWTQTLCSVSAARLPFLHRSLGGPPTVDRFQ